MEKYVRKYGDAALITELTKTVTHTARLGLSSVPRWRTPSPRS